MIVAKNKERLALEFEDLFERSQRIFGVREVISLTTHESLGDRPGDELSTTPEADVFQRLLDPILLGRNDVDERVFGSHQDFDFGFGRDSFTHSLPRAVYVKGMMLVGS